MHNASSLMGVRIAGLTYSNSFQTLYQIKTLSPFFLRRRLLHQQVRHREPICLDEEQKEKASVLLACSHFNSSVNLSQVARLAGCFAVPKIIVTGSGKLKADIARESKGRVELETKGSLVYALRDYKKKGYKLVALEQSSNSRCLFDFNFPARMVLVIGNERSGVPEDVLRLVDSVVEIPVYGMPHSHNVASATAMCLYEYAKQHFPGASAK
eukprot:Nk52_evm2s338 gene=Nk52_evmTU2s338